jgi:hypothetical protein
VYGLDTRDELLGQDKHRLERKFVVAELEQILQARTWQIVDRGVIASMNPRPVDRRNTDKTLEAFTDTCLIFKLSMVGTKLDLDFLSCDDIYAQVGLVVAADRLLLLVPTCNQLVLNEE